METKKLKLRYFQKALTFEFRNKELEIVSDFTHLGVIFQRTVSFKIKKNNLVEKTSKVMYDILRKGRTKSLSKSCQFDLFDNIVISMLSFESEVWGFKNIDILEKLHMKFCRR